MNHRLQLCFQGRPQDLGGGPRICFQIWEVACREAMGVRGHAPPRNFFKTGNLVRFRVYFDQILSLYFFQKLPFFI